MRRLVGFFVALYLGAVSAQSPNMFDGPFRTAKGTEFDRWPTTVYVDPDIEYARITKEPGKNSQDCLIDKSQCIGWPDGQTKIIRDTSTPIQERDELDLRTGGVETVQYMKVKFQYEREFKKADGSTGVLNQDKEGWIDTRVLRKEKLEPIYKEVSTKAPRAEETPVKRARPPKPADCKIKGAEVQNRGSVGDLGSFLAKTDKEQLSATTELLKPLVGQCPLHPPDEKKPQKWSGKNIYDTEALPLLTAKKSKLPKVPKLDADGKTLGEASFNDLVAVDTLARTLYSEMNECFERGLQFPMAAAKVALNREKMVNAGTAPKHFYGPPQVGNKPALSKVLTSPYQFSVWNQIGVANPNDKTVLMSLCPTRDESPKNWKGSKGTPVDLAAWDMALKIATEAVLFNPRFEAKTKQVSQLYYTSKRESYDSRSRPSPAPVIEGRVVESFRCMYVWNGK